MCGQLRNKYNKYILFLPQAIPMHTNSITCYIPTVNQTVHIKSFDEDDEEPLKFELTYIFSTVAAHIL